METLRERLISARTATGLSQAELADEVKRRYPDADITQQSISGVERGKSATISTLAEIAEILNVNTDWLALGKGPRDRTDTGYYVRDAKLIAAVKLMEPMTDYEINKALKILDTLAQPPDITDDDHREDKNGTTG